MQQVRLLRVSLPCMGEGFREICKGEYAGDVMT